MLEKELDKFYTKPEISSLCIGKLRELYEIENYQLIEPSAGNGSFSNQLDMLAFDIEPEHKDIIRLNYLEDDISSYINEKTIVLGNPPFGKKGKDALKFIEKSLSYTDIIAFILPVQFRKWSLQKEIPMDLKLVLDMDLPSKSFYHKGKEYELRCCFQIWDKNSLTDLRIKEKPKTSHPDFECYQYNRTDQSLKYFDYKWDFAVPRQGYQNYKFKAKDKKDCDKKKQWIFIKANTPEALSILENIDYDSLSKLNTGTPGFGKADLIKEYEKKKGKI